jgi:hypothetical protein
MPEMTGRKKEEGQKAELMTPLSHFSFYSFSANPS